MATTATALQRADTLYRAGDYQAAATVLEPLSHGPTAAPEVLRLLGMAKLRLGAHPQAQALLARAHAACPTDPWIVMQSGLALQADHQHAAALDKFRHAARLAPLEAAPLINMSAAYLALADPQNAIRAARRARLRAPNLAATHYTLGTAYLAGGALAAAHASFTKTVALAPDFADGWVNLGVTAYRNGEILAAKHAMRQALRAAPGHQAAAANLGSFMRLTGEAEAGEKLLEHRLAHGPDAPAVRINLAVDYLQDDRAAEALALLTPPFPPEMQQHAALQRVLALIGLRQIPAARALLDEIGAVPPVLEALKQWRHVLLASAMGDEAALTRAITAMTQALHTQGMLPEHRIMAHYDLARFHLQRNDSPNAFLHWQHGHDLLAKMQPFSRAAHARFIDASMALFSAARLAGPRATNSDDAPVFVVGMPRSGTTLVEQILAAHGQVHGAGERNALSEAFYLLGGAHNPAALHRVAALDTPALDEAAAQYLAALHALAPQAKRIVDKMPGNFLYLGLAALLFPKARIISCQRDPRDIGFSIFTFRFYGTHAYAHDLADLGWYIGQQRRLMAHWQAVLPNPVCQVNLSDWVEDFDGTLHRVLAFLDLPYDPACETFYDNSRRVRTVSRHQVKEKVNARGIGRWRAHAAQLAKLIAELEQSGALPPDATRPG
jgi:Flp pilus assembly protein TadD